jgi:hypothetical protein
MQPQLQCILSENAFPLGCSIALHDHMNTPDHTILNINLIKGFFLLIYETTIFSQKWDFVLF